MLARRRKNRTTSQQRRVPAPPRDTPKPLFSPRQRHDAARERGRAVLDLEGRGRQLPGKGPRIKSTRHHSSTQPSGCRQDPDPGLGECRTGGGPSYIIRTHSNDGMGNTRMGQTGGTQFRHPAGSSSCPCLCLCQCLYLCLCVMMMRCSAVQRSAVRRPLRSRVAAARTRTRKTLGLQGAVRGGRGSTHYELALLKRERKGAKRVGMHSSKLRPKSDGDVNGWNA